MPRYMMARVGRRLVPTDRDSEEAIERVPLNEIVAVEIVRPRSTQNHKHFFAGIAAAARGWPEGQPPHPEGDAERLRAWLLVRAGFADTISFSTDSMKQVVTMIAALNARGMHPIYDTGFSDGKPAVHLHLARSIAWSNLDERAFQDIKRRVDVVLLQVTGASLDQWVTGDLEAA